MYTWNSYLIRILISIKLSPYVNTHLPLSHCSLQTFILILNISRIRRVLYTLHIISYIHMLIMAYPFGYTINPSDLDSKQATLVVVSQETLHRTSSGAFRMTNAWLDRVCYYFLFRVAS